MHYIDIVILIPLLWGAYRGFMKGFIVSISTFLALILGVYGAINFSDFVSKFLIIISVVILIIGKFDKDSKLITEKIKTESLLYSPISKIVLKVYPSVEKLNIETIKAKVNSVTEF